MSSPEAKTVNAAGWLAGLRAVMGATAGTSSAALECPWCVPGLYRCPRDHVADDAPFELVTAVKVAPGTPHPSPFLADRGWKMGASGVWVGISGGVVRPK